jgi:membrane-associated phospholipid phosphatase
MRTVAPSARVTTRSLQPVQPMGERAGRFVPDAGWVTFAVVTLSVLSALAVAANTWLITIDEPLSRLARVGSLEGVAHITSMIGGTETAVVVAVALAALTWRRCRSVSVAIPITITAGAVLNVVLKTVIDRPRPPMPATGTALASFPSGHTFQATLVLGLIPLVVLVVMRRADLARWARAGAVVGIVAVAASRVVLGAHWPTDVIAGGLVGIALLEITHRVLARRHGADNTCGCALGDDRQRAG